MRCFHQPDRLLVAVGDVRDCAQPPVLINSPDEQCSGHFEMNTAPPYLGDAPRRPTLTNSRLPRPNLLSHDFVSRADR